jgi:hypothetical protein
MREITPVKPEKKKDSDGKNESPNRGKLIIDATCAPADISYPTDLGLFIGSQDIIQSPFMQIGFIVQERTEHGAKKKELELVDRL